MRTRATCYKILDVLFILSYTVGYASLLKFITYAIFPIPESIQLFLYLSIIYFIRFKGKAGKGIIVNNHLILLLLTLYIWEVLQGAIIGSDINFVLVVLVNLLSTYVAYKYMSNIICIQSTINPILDAYSSYMYYTVFIVIVSSVLILTGIMSPYTNLLGTNSLFVTNMEFDGVEYYFPGCLSVIYNTSSIFLSKFNFPSLSGLSHESQAMYFAIYPAFFLLFYRKNSKFIERRVLFMFVLMTILSTSLTATVCFMLTYCFHLLWKLKDKSQFSSALLIMGLISLVVYWVLQSQFNNIIVAFFQEKANFDTVGSSGSYSLSLLDYIISPTAVLGQGILGSTAEQGLQISMNCGYISSILISIFYLYYLYVCIKNIFSDDILCHSIGLASFYFIAHSLKYGIQVFNNTYIFFMVFLLAFSENIRLKSNMITNNQKVDNIVDSI